MSKQVHVTGAQRDAARMIVQRSTASGRPVSPSVRKIADASTRSAGIATSTVTTTRSDSPQPRVSAPSGSEESRRRADVPDISTDRPHHSASDVFKMIKASLRRRPAR